MQTKSSTPEGKQAQAVRFFREGKTKEALRLASDFRIGVSEKDRKTLKRGYECMVHPDTYRQMGIDPDTAELQAWAVFMNLFIMENANG